MEGKVENFRETADNERLGEAGHADHEHMTLDHEGHEEVPHDLVLADDAMLEFLRQALEGAAHAGEKLNLFLGEIGAGIHKFVSDNCRRSGAVEHSRRRKDNCTSLLFGGGDGMRIAGSRQRVRGGFHSSSDREGRWGLF
jgi:hypothetical protein